MTVHNFRQSQTRRERAAIMPRAKTAPFKTKLTEHVHTVSDGKGRKVPAIALLYNRDAYNTITYSSYKNKSDDAEFCILFATFINHHIDPENQKLVANEGYSKNDTRVISKNIRHAPRIVEFFEEYEQYGSAGRKQLTTTIFDNPRKQDSSGFLTLTFNGGIETDDLPEGMKNAHYLHVVNGLSAKTGPSGSSLVKSFPQSEFVFLEEDMNRYIQFIKDVAIHYNFLQDFNKEESSAKSVLKASFQQRLEMLESRKDEASGANKAEKKKKIIEKKVGETQQSSDTALGQTTQAEKKKKIIKRRQRGPPTPAEENPSEKKRKLASVLESKKKELKKASTGDSQKAEKGDPKNVHTVKKGITREASAGGKEVAESSDEKGEYESESGVEEYEEVADVELLDDDLEEEDGEGSGSEGEDDDGECA